MSAIHKNYIKVVEDLKSKIRQARLKVAISANAELIQLYWEIGKIIIEQQSNEGWGAKIIDKLAIDLKTEFPDFKGLSVRNLKYMRAFAEAYKSTDLIVQAPPAQLKKDKLPFVQVPLAQITWYHHITLLDKIKDANERKFYIQKAIENGWSRNVMVQQIDSNLYTRQGKAITNFKTTLPPSQSDLANDALKNPYVLDFMGISEDIKEREFEKALIQHLGKFILELGRGFAFVGNQKNLNVAGNDYFLDLLFYNYQLHCFVIFELKVDEFKPEYAGKLNFYVNTVNEHLKGEKDNPTIGVLLCKTPNETVVKYSLQNIKAPIGVSDYKLANVLPKQIKIGMPTVEELELEIEKEIEALKQPVATKLNQVKKIVSGLNKSKAKSTVKSKKTNIKERSKNKN